MSFIKDYKYGIDSQNEILDKLRTFFKAQDLQIIEYKFSLFDFHAKDLIIELKSRRVTKDFYETTMIGCNKLLNAGHKLSLNSSLKIVFVFKFIDCLTYWNFTTEKMKRLQIQKNGRNDRGRSEQGLYFHIPNKDLIEF